VKRLFLFLALFPLLHTGCTFLTDFGDDDSANNVTNNNNGNPEICTNGLDDDGDGDIDCWDQDCNDEAPCRCDASKVFFDSEKSCDHDEMCLVYESNGIFFPECAPLDRTSDGEMYDACGDNGECPMGSFCLVVEPFFHWECVPICSKEHDICPYGRGACIASYDDTAQPDDLSFCIETHVCRPDEPESCAALDQPDKGCYAFVRDADDSGTTTRCMTSGENGFGAECEYWSDCEPGLVCIDNDQTGKKNCLKWCDLRKTAPCAEVGMLDWYCLPINADPWGICVPPTSTGGK